MTGIWPSCFLNLLLLLISATLTGQTMYLLDIHPLDQDSLFPKKKIQYKTAFPDTAQLQNELKNILRQLHSQAYLEASFDSLSSPQSGSLPLRGTQSAVTTNQPQRGEQPTPKGRATNQPTTIIAHLHTGPPYEWAVLRNGNVDGQWLGQSGFRERLFSGNPMSYLSILKSQERLLQQAENNGYPFASVFLNSIKIEAGRVEAQVFLEKGKLVLFDSLNVEGDAKIAQNYLRNYLGIQAGELYSRRRVLKIKDRLKELPFVREKKNATVGFLDDKASINLYLEKRKASRFDFLLGFLPNSQRTGSKLLLTGTFNAEMQNQFGRGERLFVAFERLRPQTQKLELAFAYPYMLGLPFGVDLKFKQYKRDSTYTDVSGDFGVQYLFEGGNYLKAFWNSTASNLIAVDTAAIRQGRFPNQLDVKNNGFGLEASWQRLDYRFNPRRGWGVLAKASAGQRQIRRSQAILDIAENFYDSLPGQSFRFVFEGNVERFIPVMQRSAVKLAARGGALLSENPVYQNEQYRLGGNHLLRGFDEESIFATFFTVFTVEYRLLIGQNSFFYLLGDWAYVEDRRAGQAASYSHPLGFGAGLTFETTAGVFGISMAVGKSENAPADFRNPKIHFGYVSFF